MAKSLVRAVEAMGWQLGQPAAGPNSYLVGIGGNAEQLQSQLTRAQWRLMEDRYHPMEDQMIAFTGDRRLADLVAGQAGSTVARAFAGAEGTTDRNLARYGVVADADQRRALDRRSSMAQELAVARTENSTRRQIRDLQTALSGDLMQIGNDIAGQSSSDVNAAGGLAAARQSSYDQAKAAHKQNMISTGLTAAALALAFL